VAALTTAHGFFFFCCRFQEERFLERSSRVCQVRRWQIGRVAVNGHSWVGSRGFDGGVLGKTAHPRALLLGLSTQDRPGCNGSYVEWIRKKEDGRYWRCRRESTHPNPAQGCGHSEGNLGEVTGETRREWESYTG